MLGERAQRECVRRDGTNSGPAGLALYFDAKRSGRPKGKMQPCGDGKQRLELKLHNSAEMSKYEMEAYSTRRALLAVHRAG